MQNPNVQSVKLFTPGKPVNSQQGSDGIFISLPPGKKEAGNPVPRPSHLPERLDRFCHSQVESALQAYVHRQMPQLSSQLTALRASQNAEPLIHPALCFPQTRSNRPSRRQKEAGRPRPVLPSPERGAVSQLFSCEKGASPRRPRLRRSCRPLGKRAAGVPGDGVVISRAAAPRRSLDRRARVFFQPLIAVPLRPVPERQSPARGGPAQGGASPVGFTPTPAPHKSQKSRRSRTAAPRGSSPPPHAPNFPVGSGFAVPVPASQVSPLSPSQAHHSGAIPANSPCLKDESPVN